MSMPLYSSAKFPADHGRNHSESFQDEKKAEVSGRKVTTIMNPDNERNCCADLARFIGALSLFILVPLALSNTYISDRPYLAVSLILGGSVLFAYLTTKGNVPLG